MSLVSPAFDRQALYQLSHQGSSMLNNTETWRKNFPDERRASSEALGSGMTMLKGREEASVAGPTGQPQQMPRDRGRF